MGVTSYSSSSSMKTPDASTTMKVNETVNTSKQTEFYSHLFKEQHAPK